MDSDEDLAWEGMEFGQREPLTRRIRTLLKDYPDGLPVPKELIQNADDAKATEACLMLDMRTHTTEHLINDELAQFQGPALVFWDNKPFQDSDFENLCEFGGETKLDDRKKVGKFGLGFNSVYNLTDLPQFVSKTSLCLLDPHEKFLRGKRGARYDLTAIRKQNGKHIADSMVGQLKPFHGLFGFSVDKMKSGETFEGTIFRFPLRTEDHAKWSKICDQPYTIASAMELIKMTKDSSHLFLIFLQFVNKFVICLTQDHGIEVLSNFSRNFLDSNDIAARVLFKLENKFKSSYKIRIQDTQKSQSYQWDIFVTAPGKKSLDGTRCVGSIAFPSHDLDLTKNCTVRILFCFLPLPHPQDTGLPFLVNGTFAVTSSRRYLELNSADDKSADKSGDGSWNRDILQLCAAESLCTAVLNRSCTHSQEHLFHLFPKTSNDADPLCKLVMETFYTRIASDPLLTVFCSPNSLHLVALCNPKVFLISDDIADITRQSLLTCLAVLKPETLNGAIYLVLPPKILDCLRLFASGVFGEKEKSFVDIFHQLIPLSVELYVGSNEVVRENFLSIVHYALDQMRGDTTVMNVLKNYSWVSTKSVSGHIEMKRPLELVNPDSKIAEFLHFTGSFFPCEGMKLTEEHKEFMSANLGLNNLLLPCEALNSTVQNMNTIDDFQNLCDRMQQLLVHINSNESYYADERLKKILADHFKIPIKISETKFQRSDPNQVYQVDSKVLVSYVHLTCDFTMLGITRDSFVDKTLNIFKSVPICDVLQNWRLLVADENKTFNSKCEEILCILRYLQKESSMQRREIIAQVFKATTTSPLFPSHVEEKFCLASQMCLNQHQPVFERTFYRINSYLCKNDEISVFLQNLGIAKDFEPIFYKRFLENCESIENEIQAIQVRDILEYLRSRKEMVGKLPDDNDKFRNVEELCLNDFELKESLTEISPLHCHRIIPHDLALFFGVKTKRSMLETLSSDPSFESFSQKEDLCNRLYRITTSYSNPMDMFKELIQNADDARASEIQFILDDRNLPKQRVVNDNWEKLLEPALLVFNDAFFTSDDIKGIKDLGRGSKGDDVDKIGQFGVGFNCVFSITDYPCFLTQVDGQGPGNMCLLDPSCQITPHQGKKININQDLLKNFPDTFGCFLAANRKLDGRKGKTMFRLPFRRNESSLGKRAPNCSEMYEKLQQLAAKVPEYLLFLRNIKTIRISRTNPAGNLTEIAAFSKSIDKLTSELSKVQINSISSRSKKVSEWLLNEREISSQQIPSIVHRSLFLRDLKLREHGAVAFPLFLDDSVKNEVPGVYCYLPIEEASAHLRAESVAIPVVVNGQFFLDESRRMISLQPQEPKGTWNIHILQHVVGPAYGALIRYFTSTIKTQIAPGDSIHYFLSMLPKLRTSSQLVPKSMQSNLGYHISLGMMRFNADYAWIPSVNTDKKIVDFLNLASIRNLMVSNGQTNNKDLILYKISSALHIPLTQIGPEYVKCWAQVGIVITSLSPNDVISKLADAYIQPTRIEETAFENSSNLVVFLNWSKKELSAHPDPKSLPIFLSANGILLRNTANELYSSALSIADIFPRLRGRILDIDVDGCLRPLKLACNLEVDEFFAYMAVHFNQILVDQIVCWSQVTGEINERWVRLVWNFLAHHQKEVLEKFLVLLKKMSILLCSDKRGVLKLMPLSMSTDYVFSSFQIIRIGSVSINTKDYSSFYRISDELHHIGTQRKAFASKFIMPSILTVERHLHILHVINKENHFDKFSDTQRKQLYSYFRDSFCNDQSIFRTNEIDKLRQLPIFSFVKSTVGCQPLSVFNSVVSMSRDVPLVGLTLADNEVNRVFVHREALTQGAAFQEKLGIESISDSELYSIFIPNFFPHMKNSEMKTHFHYLERKLSDMTQADQNLLKDTLQKTEYVADEHGNKLVLGNVAQIELRIMVGYIMPITDFNAVGIAQIGLVDKLVGAYKIPKVSEILSNWKMLSDDSSKEFDLKCSEIREIIDYLAKNLDKGAYEQVADALKKHNLLPANGVNQFCRSASICLDENAPVYNGYLYRVNFLVTKGCQNLSKLFLRNCKLVDKFAPSEYSELINSFQTVESPEQIQQIVLILWFICKDGYKVDYVDIRQLPDTYSRMRPIDELCLDDMELSRNALEDSLNFCHEALPHQLCKNLGVKTKRSKLKEMNSDHRFESFFQREDIKERLARIAESYSNPMDIFKELIQNADDAQATQVHFILDQRKLPAKYVIDHGFEKLLDPALLVYNNVPFKTSDIEGIQRVGSGSKGDDVEKIGQFGVGFNCVYSLTDFPCFLTQVDGVGLGNLLLLDPQGVIIEQGGCKIDVRSETYMEAVKDSFNCFLRENEQLDATNGGSMFRFPLRVKRSKLGKAAPILSEMEEKMNEFSSKIAEYLLFVNNITSIKVSVLKETGTMRCLGAFSKTFSGDNETALKEFRSHTRQFLSVSYRHELLTKRNIIYNIDIIDDMRGKKIAAWKVSEQLGSERSVPDIIRKSTTGKCKIKQHASVAIPLFLDGRLKHKVPGLYCYLPVEDASSQLRNESVEIPVVVNGQFFLDESRRMLSLQSREPKGAWNIHVLQDIVGPAYAKMLKQFIEHWTENKASFHLNEFLNKFPCCRDNNLELKATDNMASFVTRGFLCEMNKFNWIPCMSFVHELFEFESVTCAKNVAYLANDNLSFSIYSTSQNLGVKLTRLPLKYTILWDCYGASLSKMTPTDIICLLRELPDHPLKIEESVFRSVQNLAVFLQWSSNELLTLGSANDLPIYLTADGFLLKNSSIQLYSSALSIAQIFPHLSNRIMHHDIDQLLKKLKMTREMKLEEFLDYLKKYNPDYCQGKVIEINPGDVYQMSRWVELVWVFLHARINPHSIVTDSTFDNFSVLLCTDKNRGIFMRPISAGKVDTFLKLDKFLIGSVEICTEKYNGLYNLVDSLKKENLAWSKLVASAVLSKNLNIQQQITILRIIKDEFDFNESERLQLYQYFKNVFQNTSSIDQESINYLRELPIFAIIPDQVDSLLGGLCVYSVPREIPRQGLNLSASVAYKYVYEEITPKAIEFQKRLGIINFTTTQMYVETIIPLLFERFELNCLSVHLDFISEILPQLSIDNRKVILICLSQCKFIHTNDDHKREPKCFYDRSCPLFLVFKDGNQMLPWQYVKFRDLLSLCGLNHTVTEDDFWDFITRYSANPSRENSLTILGHFLKSFRGLKLSPNKFSKVGRLPIFETEKHGYQKLCDVYLNQHTTLVEFVEPVLNFDTSFLLQEKPINLKSFWQIWLDQENSGLEKKPTAAIVLKNLEKLIQSESPNDSKNLKCLRFIAEEASSGTQMDRSILERLSCIPCVTSGNGKLLPPRQICKSFECRIESHDLLEVQKFSGLSYCELGTYVNEPSSLFMAEWDYLQILGATKFVTLQQTAFAVHQFYGVVMTGDIWNKNPNSLNRFFVLKDHFEELVAKKPSELSSLSSECPLYDITIDENMVDISGAVVIDKPSLYSSLQESSLGTESHSQDDSTRLFPDSSVIDVNSSYAENLKLLPAPLRPKFFSEICHIEIDSSTFEESNSAAEQFHLERISAKLQNDLFIEKLAHVLEHREKLVHNYLSQNESRNQKKFETPRLVFLKNCTLRPVKRLYFQYSIDINGKEINGIIEREFDYRENPNPEIFFTISDISSETQPQEAKRSKELFKEITKHLFVPEKLDCYQLDTQVIKFLAKLIFVCRSEDEEGYQLRKFNIPPFNRVSIAKDRRDLLVGNIVPLAFCALIDYSTDQKVKYGDIVAIQESCVNKHELVFKYAKYVGEVHDSNDSSNHSVRCLLFRIQVDRDTILNLNPKQVFTFRDKLDTGTNESQLPSIDENTEEEQFERDVMNIRQIISTAVTSQKPGERLDSNMDELERRLLQSYLRKYSSPDQQQKLIRIVSESIGTEKEAHNIEAVAEAGDASRTINQTQQPEPDMRVNNFLKLNFERMNREINAHTEQLKVHKKRKNHGTFYAESFRRPQSLINYRGRSSHSNLGIQFHIEALTQPQPNPTLAKLWLKQAKEHWMFLNGKVEEDRDTNQESYRNWRLEISLKVIESSLIVLIYLEDGSNSSSIYDRLQSKKLTGSALELVAILRNLDSGLNLKLEGIKAVLKQLGEYDNLHRPDQGQNETSGALVKPEDVEQTTKCAKEVYELALEKSLAAEL